MNLINKEITQNKVCMFEYLRIGVQRGDGRSYVIGVLVEVPHYLFGFVTLPRDSALNGISHALVALAAACPVFAGTDRRCFDVCGRRVVSHRLVIIIFKYLF